MRKLFPLLVAAMMLSLAACGGPVTISSAAAGPGQEVVFQKDEGDEYIDPQLLTGLTEDGEDYFLLSGNEPSQAVQTGGGYAAAALSAQPNLSLLVPNSGGEIARSLTQDTAILSWLAPDAASVAGLAPSSTELAGLAPNSADIAGLAPNSTDIAQMAPDPVDDISKLAPGAGEAIPGMSSGNPVVQSERNIVANAGGVVVGPDDILNVAPNAGVAVPEDANGTAQAVTPDGQEIIDAVEALEEGEAAEPEN